MSALTSRWKSAYQDMDVKSISTFDAPQSITTIDEFDGNNNRSKDCLSTCLFVWLSFCALSALIV